MYPQYRTKLGSGILKMKILSPEKWKELFVYVVTTLVNELARGEQPTWTEKKTWISTGWSV